MALFDKKNCSVCGAKIGLLGGRKLSDGNLCRDCAKKAKIKAVLLTIPITLALTAVLTVLSFFKVRRNILF